MDVVIRKYFAVNMLELEGVPHSNGIQDFSGPASFLKAHSKVRAKI